MSSVSLDSEAAFEDRCRKIGISDDLLKAIVDAGYNTFGKVSFAAASTPQNLTDSAVDEWLKSVVKPLPSAFQVACVRRLLYESQLMRVADLAEWKALRRKGYANSQLLRGMRELRSIKG